MGSEVSRRAITPPAQLYAVERAILAALISRMCRIHLSYMTCADTPGKALWLLTWPLSEA